jgi:O-antigen ligase
MGPLFLLVILYGGARPWLQLGLAGLFFVLLGFLLARQALETKQEGVLVPLSDAWPSWLPWAAAALALVPLIQLLPLPLNALQVLSPVRAHWVAIVRAEAGPTCGTLSYDPLVTGQQLLWWLFLAVYLVFFTQSLQRRSPSGPLYPHWFFTFLFVLGALEACYGILQTLVPSLGVLGDRSPSTGMAYRGYARGTFINRNHFAAFLGLIWPVLFAYILVLRSPRKMERILAKRERAQILLQKKAFGVFCLGLIVLGLVFSQSRGGILSAVLAFSLLCFFAGIRQKKILAALAACWLVMLGYGFVIGFEGIIQRFSQIEQGAAGRLEIWKDSWTALQDHPLTGTGLGTYPETARVYQNAFGPERRASHAHNDYLEAAVEMGLPASILLASAVWGLWWRQALLLWRRRKGMEADRLLLASAPLAALAGYLLHCWVEFNNAIPANQLTALLTAALHFSVMGEPPVKASNTGAPRNTDHDGSNS